MRFAQWPNSGHHRFFEEAARVHGELQDFGTARYDRLRAREGRMVLAGCDVFSPAYCATLYGYYEQCLYQHGAIRVKIDEVTCDSLGDQSCTFAMRWR